MSLHQSLRLKHPQFFYRSANWQIEDGELELSWKFEVAPGIKFQPQMAFSLPPNFEVSEQNTPVIDELVFQIGLVELLSYWKATASPQIVIEAGKLTPDQISWWKKLLIKGMGEYFYSNQIDFTADDFLSIQTTNQASDQDQKTDQLKTSSHDKTKPTTIQSKKTKYLLPLGGGKDSAVTLELMLQYQKEKQPSIELITMAINPTPASRQMAQVAGLPLIEVRRRLDPKLIELNHQDYLNGHTPFSALIAMTYTLVGYLYNCTDVVLSNESSSNEGNITYLGQEVNHQYSKTFEFESDFRDYVQTILQPLLPKDQILPSYFSLLRPFYELKIGQMFAKLGQAYFSIFRSCNRGQKMNVWCGECSKCLFAFTILFPFLGAELMVKIFGQNLFHNSRLNSLALELIGEKATKPFDCVGTHQESLVAFYMSSQWYLDNGQPLPELLKKLQPILAQKANLPDQVYQVLNWWDKNNFLPKDLTSFIISCYN